ncbi:putative LLM family oxidoreductase [Naumannella cuiyingiana]|uniref:Putative LLM family oxidoreductase n=1 Tax=Naumannella cuiyingiana TaxID=1347891 RepID=A0A7Z0IKV1_9ACTN|nr:LLM class flavin-dependent oxidoreductase [Naumannella cuiyingiana]NYI70908.1 putative LLM family oxidoreductase [Naumannella cuiyingiana]
MAVDPAAVKFGLNTFGTVVPDEQGKEPGGAEVIRQVVEEGVLADELGLDAFDVGEHHRPDMAVSAPDIVLAALAGRTSKVKLGSAVTVLSSDDPVRVFERFSTIDAISRGRAEVILGRGSFTESFPLFGFDLADYDMLFSEKLDLFAELIKERPVTWSGSHRRPLEGADVFPKTESGRLGAWIGVGGSPESVVRTVNYQIPMMLAIIGGDSERFVPYVDLYERAQAAYREQVDASAPERLPLGVHSPGFVGEDDESAREAYWPGYARMRERIGRQRGWPPPTREEFDEETRTGSQYVGSPETVARRIARTISLLQADRFDLKYDGAVGHDQLMGSIERYATQVVPRVRELLAEG